MGKVQILSEDIIKRISAGEVIERPASIVKELLENSLDAKADSMEIYIQKAGKKLIKIKDSGVGIEYDDIEKIFYRHATSKISSIGDLDSISSLGFRGEALYSIAAISDIIVSSRTQTSQTGWEIHIRGGEKIGLKPVSMLLGTSIEVREIFFNTPARRKFLKSDTSEMQQILNIIIPYTIIYHNCRFLLNHNNRIIFDLSPAENILDRIEKILNINKEHLIVINKEIPDEKVSLRLILGDVNIQRVRKDMQFIFINGRPVQNRGINTVVNLVYKEFFPPEVYPFFIIDMKVPVEDIDVNVHPTKREVKINNEFNLTLLLRSLCTETLVSYGKAKNIEFSSQILQKPSQFFTLQDKAKQQSDFLFTTQQKLSPAENKPGETVSSTLLSKLTNAQYIGSFLNKYIIFDSGDSILFIDQHSAHERITFERYKKEMETGQVEVQTLLIPFLIKLSYQEMLMWEETKGFLEEIGFSTTKLDNQTIAVHSHPIFILRFQDAVKNILTEDKKIITLDKEEIAKRACRFSVMAGTVITKQEAEHIRDSLIKCSVPFVCPHGRPTVIEISEKTLDKQFLRE